MVFLFRKYDCHHTAVTTGGYLWGHPGGLSSEIPEEYFPDLLETLFGHTLSDHPKPANEYHLKTGQRERRLGH